MAKTETTRNLSARAGAAKLTQRIGGEGQVALALRHASAHAKKQLATQGYKLPTQNWTGSAVRNPAI